MDLKICAFLRSDTNPGLNADCWLVISVKPPCTPIEAICAIKQERTLLTIEDEPPARV